MIKLNDGLISFAIIVGIFCAFILTMTIIDYIETKKDLMIEESKRNDRNNK